jgi:inner membrane protein
MEPVTHFLTGACMGRAGFNRKTAYATLAMTLAAEAPDLDVLWSVRGPVAAFQHHRGWTHSLLGAPIVAAAVVGVVWLWHRWRQGRSRHKATQQPRWGLLWFFSLLAALSHILLDYTNNYGVRPFYPFSARWYSADLVFIVEPVFLAVLILALVMPAIFGLADSEIGAGRQKFRGRGWAIFALLVMVVTWIFRAGEHGRAIELAGNMDFQGAAVLHVAAEPYPVNPFHWHVVVDTPNFYQLVDVDTRNDQVTTSPQTDVLYKPAVTPAVRVAEQSWLGKVYLDWSKYPYVEEIGVPGNLPPEIADKNPATAVNFRDLRFTYNVLALRGREHPPLSGTVYLNAADQVVGMQMGGHVQH